MAKDPKSERALVLSHKGSLDYVKNPMSIVERLGSFSLTQQRIVFEMLTNIQDHIKRYLDSRSNGAAPDSYQLLTNSDFDVDGNVVLNIPLNSVSRYTAEYDDVKKAAKAMSCMLIEVEYVDEYGVLKTGQRQLFAVDIPKADCGRGKRSTGFITVEINRHVAKTLFNMEHGYAEHIKDIVSISKGKYTVAIYGLLSKYFNIKEYGGECEIKYSSLRQKLKVDEKVVAEIQDPVTGQPKYVTTEERKYVQYKDFKKRVLNAACEELKKLWDADKGVDFYFEFRENFNNSTTTKGGPRSITFIMKNDRPTPEEAKATVDAAALKMFEEYRSLVQQEVSAENYKVYMSDSCPMRMVGVGDEDVKIAFETSTFYNLWLENIYQKAPNAWMKVFGKRSLNPQKM